MDREWPTALRVAHLKGGLRAINSPGPQVEFIPFLPESPNSFNLEEYRHLHGILSQHVSTVVGMEFVTHQMQVDGHIPTEWRPYYWKDGGDLAHDATVLWSNLATGGHHLDNYPFVDLCRRVVFQIEAASWRLYELSESYHKELVNIVANDKFKDGQRIETLNSFFIYLATHSFLSEAATLRDYLGEFTAKYVLNEYLNNSQNIRLMSTLRAEIAKKECSHPVAAEISEITNGRGWLKEMSAYRDLAVHYTPLASAEKRGWIKQKAFTDTSKRVYPSIEFSLPKDPHKVKEIRSTGKIFHSAQEWLKASFLEDEVEHGPDALLYCHRALGNLCRLAKKIAGHSPILPKQASFRLENGNLRRT
ncbi:MAG: hypothetical protein ACK4FK_18285 [Ferrovibrio sp.]|uniref:hypothetical protein n=1 Tax=Ferrovibrio sp. TaxID=1917215 RepID=UPI00391A0DBE